MGSLSQQNSRIYFNEGDPGFQLKVTVRKELYYYFGMEKEGRNNYIMNILI